MKLSVAVLIAMVALVSGCATYYVSPADPSAATLTLHNKSKWIANFMTWDDGENCSSKTVRRIAFDATENWQIVPDQSFAIKVKPDQPFTLDGSMFFNERVSCQVRATFIAQKNQAYVVTYGDREGGCRMSILRVVSGAGSANPVLEAEESVRQRVAIHGGDDKGYSCK